MNPSLFELPRWHRPSVPAPGTSLVAATETFAGPVRAAVECVRRCLDERPSVSVSHAHVLASRWREEPRRPQAPSALQAAWALVSMRIVGRSVGALPRNASLRDAEAWFVGAIPTPSRLSDAVVEFADREATRKLETIEYDNDLRDLLPYVLDAHGPGSRASVMRDPRTGKARRAKKDAGVFYTPADVAEYIVREAMQALPPEAGTPLVLDPACGSGVFLKAVLDLAADRRPSLDRLDFVERSLHGIDVDPLAVDAACFVLLHECLRSAHRRQAPAPPWSQWHRIRCNLCVADALTFRLAQPGADRADDAAVLTDLRRRLDSRYVEAHPAPGDTTATLFSRGQPLASVFPTLAEGAHVVIGNPPYAPIGPRDDAAALTQRFASLPAGHRAGWDHFPAFVEMMWRLALPGRASSGMVVPLSLASSRRAQMTATRRAIMRSGGRWRFAFFDREPHALFGEEVKTRNAIVFRADASGRRTTETTIETGPLRRWTSRQRAALFDTVAFTPLPGVPIAAGVPKLDGDVCARAYRRLRRQTLRLRDMCATVDACLPQDAAAEESRPRVFVAGTAYNFLNAFLSHRDLPEPRAPWSSSKLLCLGLRTAAEAHRVFAILSSRIAYWLWHVTADGFHVTRSFVLDLPVNDRLFSEPAKHALADVGSRLWEKVQAQRIISINGGRQTVSYRPHASEDLRDEIDARLLEALGLEPAFLDYLRSFTRTLLFVDEDDDTRRRFTEHFSDGGQPWPE